MRRRCQHCGKYFIPRTGLHRYCTETHRLASLRQKLGKIVNFKKHCSECKRPFVARQAKQMVCGYRCRADRAYRKLQERRAWKQAVYDAVQAAPAGAIEGKRKCSECPIRFVPSSPAQKTCSQECAVKNRNRMKRKNREKRKLAGKSGRPKQGAAVAFVSPRGLACDGCANWKPMDGAELGGYCTVSRWLICKPMTPGAKPYQPREVHFGEVANG